VEAEDIFHTLSVADTFQEYDPEARVNALDRVATE